MNLADAIVPGVSLIVGAAVSYFALDKRQAVSEAVLTTKLDAIEKSIDRGFSEVKAEHIRSAGEQGTRIGNVETHVDALLKFQAKIEGRLERDHELSEAHDGRVR